MIIELSSPERIKRALSLVTQVRLTENFVGLVKLV